MLYSILRHLARIALRWYYSDVEVVGLERVPARAPVLLAGNHPNALMDALVIAVLLPRPVRLLAKSTLFTNPLFAGVLRAVGVIPLYRTRDAVPGDAAATDPSRNARSFQEVFEALADGSAVAIFPEGTSHDGVQLAPLRTGLARMAIETRDTHAVRGLSIVPLGLVFESKETPRTRVLMQVGEPLHLDDPAWSDTTVASLTSEIDKRLREVTLNFSNTEDAARMMSLAHALGVLFAPVRPIGDERFALADMVQLVRRIHLAASRITGEFTITTGDPHASVSSTGSMRIGASDVRMTTRVQQFEKRFGALQSLLAREELALEDIAIDVDSVAGTRFAVREGLLALVRGPIGLWGRVNHWLPITLTRLLALRRVESRDQPAMRSVVFGLVLVLTFYALQTGLVAWLTSGWWALAYALTLVPSASNDFRYGDRVRRALARMRAYFRFRRDAALQRTLMAEADWLREEAMALESLISAADTARQDPSATRDDARQFGDP